MLTLTTVAAKCYVSRSRVTDIFHGNQNIHTNIGQHIIGRRSSQVRSFEHQHDDVEKGNRCRRRSRRPWVTGVDAVVDVRIAIMEGDCLYSELSLTAVIPPVLPDGTKGFR